MKFAYLIEPPFNHRTAEGHVTGSDVELARAVLGALDIGELEPVETEFADLLPGVVEGRWRMTTGLFATDERRQRAAFSRPIWALPDGLLVARGNPLDLSGYRSVANTDGCRLAVIRDQFQQRSAIEFGVPEARISVFETYAEAADAVRGGSVDAYASVARAHAGFVDLDDGSAFDVVTVPTAEKAPAFGCFAFAKYDVQFRQRVDGVLNDILGSTPHRTMMHGFGFSDDEIDLVVAVH